MVEIIMLVFMLVPQMLFGKNAPMFYLLLFLAFGAFLIINSRRKEKRARDATDPILDAALKKDPELARILGKSKDDDNRGSPE